MTKTITYIGTSGWSYPGWQEAFYKEKLSAYEQLRYYATQFNSVENNSSFYHFTKQATFQKWYDATPSDFVFSLKLNKLFTHEQKLILTDDSIARLQEFFLSLQVLKEKLGCVLVQTPPSLRYSTNLLEDFFTTCKSMVDDLEFKPDLAVELRNDAWFNEDIYRLLTKLNVALVTSQSSKYPCKKVLTADFTYLRFHGPAELFYSAYTNEQLAEWADYFNSLKNINRAYIYFNNTAKADAIPNAQYLKSLVKKR